MMYLQQVILKNKSTMYILVVVDCDNYLNTKSIWLTEKLGLLLHEKYNLEIREAQ